MPAEKKYKVLIGNGKRGTHSFEQAGTVPDRSQGAMWAASEFLADRTEIEADTPVLLLRGKKAFLFAAGRVEQKRHGPSVLEIEPAPSAPGGTN